MRGPPVTSTGVFLRSPPGLRHGRNQNRADMSLLSPVSMNQRPKVNRNFIRLKFHASRNGYSTEVQSAALRLRAGGDQEITKTIFA